MADHTYTITIQNTTDQTQQPIAGNNGKASDSTPTAPTNSVAPSATSKSGGNSSSLKRLIAVKGIVAPVVDTLVSHRISTVAVRTGAAEQQDRLSFAYSMGKQIASVALSTALGAATGNLPGALIGFALGVGNAAISYGNKVNEIQLQNDVENVGLGFMDIRAGGSVATFSGSRLRRQ